MSDLISRKALLETIEKYKFGAISNDVEKEIVKRNMLIFINGQPTIQPQGIDKDRLIEELQYYLSHTTENGKEHYAYEQCLKLINRQPTTDGWIPVSERLPSRSNEYWATIKIRGNYYVRKVNFNSFTKKWHGWVRDGDEVIAWQEEVIPQPYKESEEE